MANAIYPLAKEAMLTGTLDMSGDDIKVALIDTGTYTYSASHEFLDDISGVVGTAQTIDNPTFTAGTFDGDNVEFTAVSGSSVEALIIYLDTSEPTTSQLVAYLDTSITGLPVTPNGGNISITWNASGIFTL